MRFFPRSEVPVQPLHFDAVLQHQVDEIDQAVGVALLAREDPGVRRLAPSFVDGAIRLHPEVPQQLLTVQRGVVQGFENAGLHVVGVVA